MEWTTITTLGRAGYQVYNFRHAIKKYWIKLLAHVNKGNTDIVVTGHSGAGKSQLASQMHGRARELIYQVPEESTSVEVEAITLNEWSKLVRVLPGQAGRRTHGEIEVFDENNSLEGVIHVVDFGYVTPRDPVQSTNLVNHGYDDIEKLRKLNLETEYNGIVELLSTISKQRAKHHCPKWLVIAVNKVDLFPEEQSNALSFYHPDGGSKFGNALKAFHERVGKDAFGIYIVPCCAYETDFIWNGRKVETSLKRHEQDELLNDFMKTIVRISDIHS
jgi:hypothetical protein